MPADQIAEIRPMIKELFDSLKGKPITVTFEDENSKKWIQISDNVINIGYDAVVDRDVIYEILINHFSDVTFGETDDKLYITYNIKNIDVNKSSNAIDKIFTSYHHLNDDYSLNVEIL